MKSVLISFAVLASTSSAFAMHAYGSDTCVAVTPQGRSITIELSNTGPLDPHRINSEGLNLKIDEILWVNFGKADLGVDEPVKTAALSLEVTRESNLTSGKLDDGCLQGERSTSVRLASVVNVGARAKELFDLKKGDKLAFSCYEDYQAPSGKHCNQ